MFGCVRIPICMEMILWHDAAYGGFGVVVGVATFASSYIQLTFVHSDIRLENAQFIVIFQQQRKLKLFIDNFPFIQLY